MVPKQRGIRVFDVFGMSDSEESLERKTWNQKQGMTVDYEMPPLICYLESVKGGSE